MLSFYSGCSSTFPIKQKVAARDSNRSSTSSPLSGPIGKIRSSSGTQSSLRALLRRKITDTGPGVLLQSPDLFRALLGQERKDPDALSGQFGHHIGPGTAVLSVDCQCDYFCFFQQLFRMADGFLHTVFPLVNLVSQVQYTIDLTRV